MATPSSPDDEPDFQLLSTLRYDPQLLHAQENSPFYMLTYHRDRMLAAAKRLDWEAAAAASKLEDITTFEDFLLAEVEAYEQEHESGNPLRVSVPFVFFAARPSSIDLETQSREPQP